MNRLAVGIGLAALASATLLVHLVTVPRPSDPPATSEPTAMRSTEPTASLPLTVAVPSVQRLAPVPARDTAITIHSTTAAIGSEGYGPHVVSALASGTPEDASVAARWLLECRALDRNLERVLSLRSKDADRRHASVYKPFIEDIQARQRLCQTITQDIAALRPQLLYKAAQGGVVGAASEYVGEYRQVSALPPGTKDVVLDALRRDADAGDDNSILMLVATSDDFGLSTFDRAAYSGAYKLINKLRGEDSFAGTFITDLMNNLFASIPTVDDGDRERLQNRVEQLVTAYRKRQAEKSKS